MHFSSMTVAQVILSKQLGIGCSYLHWISIRVQPVCAGKVGKTAPGNFWRASSQIRIETQRQRRHLLTTTLPAIRIFIDCTVTQASPHQTGIERVVRNVAAHAVSAGQAIGMICRPVKLTPTGYVLVSPAALQQRQQLLPRIRTSANKAFGLCMRSLSHVTPPPFKKLVLANRHEPGFARLLIGLLRPLAYTGRLLSHRLAKQTTESAIAFQPGDILLLADSFWNYTPWSAVQAAKAAGVFVAAVVYDIIPVTHPQFFAPVSHRKFAAALALLVQHSDAFLSISAFTEMQLRQHIQTLRSSIQLPHYGYAHFALGAELDRLKPGGKTREKVKKIFTNQQPVYLVVGTLEPRKNHNYLLQTFQKLWDADVNVSLLIVGRVGWMSDSLLSQIRAHTLLGQRLFFLDDASDTELDYCYNHARAVLLASMAEGFGLPLVEALHKGLPVFASDITVFREVGGPYPAYFDLTRPDALFEQLQAYETCGSYAGRPTGEFCWPDWSHSCGSLLTQLIALHAHSAKPC
jgi:glycosyltransferase involved in cell wall biosynthesis